MRILFASTLFLIALLTNVGPACAAGSGYLGFSVTATYSGFLSPKLKRVLIADIKPGSPAEKADLRLGDGILEVNGKPIEGASARQMHDFFKNVSVGQNIALKIRRGNGAISNIVLVAAPKSH